jgi:hypothetical protein
MMQREPIIRNVLLVFVGAVVLYAVSFGVIEHLRTRKGGWQVTFSTDAQGTPKLDVAQPWLGLSNITLSFPDQHLALSNLIQRVIFDQPITNVPFGSVKYLDTTFLPGAIVFDLFGHEVQLTPRVLILDRRDRPWQNGSDVEVRSKKGLKHP